MESQKATQPEAPVIPVKGPAVRTIRTGKTALALADVVHPAQVGMCDLPCRTDFAVEPLEERRVVLQGLRQKLERDRRVEAQIIGAVHLSIPPCPNRPTIR